MANGDFSSSAVLDVQQILVQSAASPSSNNVMRTYSNPKHKTLLALVQNELNSVVGIDNPNKEQGVTVHWIEKTGVSAGNLATDCSYTPTAGGTYAEEYDLTGGKEASFSYTSATWRTSQYNSEAEYVAMMMIQHQYAIIEAVNTAAIAFLEGAIGTNAYPEGFTINGSETEVPAAAWNPSLFAHLSAAKEVNDMTNAFIVGGSLYTQDWLAMMQTDATGRNMLNDTPVYHDLKGFASDTDKPIFIVDPSAYAFATKNRYSAAPVEDQLNRIFYTVPDVFGLGLNFDVIQKYECGTDEEVRTDVKIKLRYDFFQHPISKVNTTNTGVLKYVQV